MNPLKWLLQKNEPATKETTVTDTVVEAPSEPTIVTSTGEPVTTQTTTTTVVSNDAVLDKVKEILISIGHDVEAEFDEVVALAKKLIAKA